MAERDEFGAFLLGFIVGGLTGAVASLLLAPQSGESTRTVIKEKAIELEGQMGTTIEEARTRADAIVADARKRAEAMTAEAKVRSEEIMKQARTGLEEAQKRGQVVLDEQRTKITEVVNKVQSNGGDSAPAETEG